MEERRSSTRVKISYPARLTGVDAEGRAFKEETVLDNLSVGGIHLPLKQGLLIGQNVTISVRLSTAPNPPTPTLRLAARGTVRRAERRSDGTWGVAIEFTRRRVF